jgi:hypothetical protein
MPLNPAFDQSTTRRLPCAFGYVLGQGDLAQQTVAVDGTQYGIYILGEGPWDGPEILPNVGALGATVYHLSGTPPDATIPYGGVAQALGTSGFVHFHSGEYTTKGALIGTEPTSIGPDQGLDSWWSQFPTVSPPLALSGIAYAIWAYPAAQGFTAGVWTAPSLSGMAIWRSSRCRIFDAYGNVTGYQFTCNPAWHKVEAILRYKIKPQQPSVAGLTAAEKSCFNWESIVELAARNDYLLPNGNPRFVGNYIFAADSTLAQMMELMMRVDRSYHRVQNGQIYLIGNDSRSSVFLCSANHLVPGSRFERNKKDIAKAPNVFIPAYRDLEIPAVVNVTSVALTNGAPPPNPGGLPGTTATFAVDAPSPFLNITPFVYGGSSQPTMNGTYTVKLAGSSTADAIVAGSGQVPFPSITSATGGYIGTDDSRFASRAPTTVQHRSAQRSKPAQVPGLATQPNIVPVRYDCGNSTYDQTNRLMKFERDNTLGTDIGPGWVAPISGSITCLLESVDASQNALVDCGAHDVITLDSWVFPEGPGEYEIQEIEVEGPSSEDVGQITLQLRQYNPNAPTDVSDPPGDSYKTVSSPNLRLYGFTAPHNPRYVLQGTPVGTLVGGNITISMPDLLIHNLGQPTPTAYPAAVWTGIPPGSAVILYVNDPSGIGTSPTFQVVAGTTPFNNPPAGLILAFMGTFTGAFGGGSGPVSLVYSPLFQPFTP